MERHDDRAITSDPPSGGGRSGTGRSPRRIALVITELEVGGAERCAANLALGLARRSYEPVVYSLAARPRVERAALVEQLESAGIGVEFLDLRHWAEFPRGQRALAEKLRAQRPDVVQTFLFHANVLGSRAARRAPVPHVCTGIRVADPRWSRTLLEKIATRRASRIVCVSEGVAEACRKRGFDPARLVVIPNGVRVETWKNAEPAQLGKFGVRPARPVMLYLGRLDAQKGVESLLRLVQDSRFEEADLLLVGDGPRRDACRRLAQANAHRIHFAGWQADIPGILAASDVLVMHSRWEGMPNVVLEAMAAGKPVLTTPVEGVRELLGDAYGEQTAGEHFAERLFELIFQKEAGRDLGRRNQARAEQEFSLDRMMDRYCALYEQFVYP